MRRRIISALTFLIFFMPFCMKLDSLYVVSGQDLESQSQKKQRIRTIVEAVIKSGGNLREAVVNVRKSYWHETPELTIEQRRKIEKAEQELEKMLPSTMTLTATFTTEEQVRDVIRKVQKLREEMPKEDLSLLKQRLYAEAKKHYPYIPIKPYSKIQVSYVRNGVVVECTGRFHPSANPGIVHVGPYKIPLSDILETQRCRFSREETESIRKRYVQKGLKRRKWEYDVRLQRLLDKHEDELRLHDNDVLYVRKWYTLEEYTAITYEKIIKRSYGDAAE